MPASKIGLPLTDGPIAEVGKANDGPAVGPSEGGTSREVAARSVHAASERL